MLHRSPWHVALVTAATRGFWKLINSLLLRFNILQSANSKRIITYVEDSCGITLVASPLFVATQIDAITQTSISIYGIEIGHPAMQNLWDIVAAPPPVILKNRLKTPTNSLPKFKAGHSSQSHVKSKTK